MVRAQLAAAGRMTTLATKPYRQTDRQTCRLTYPLPQGRIAHFANFPATGVSLRQMVQFGEKPSVGELPTRLDWPVRLNCIVCCALETARGPSCSHVVSQVPSSAPRSSSPRSSPYGWHIASRSSTTFPTASARCPRSAVCMTGMPSRSRYVPRNTRPTPPPSFLPPSDPSDGSSHASCGANRRLPSSRDRSWPRTSESG